MSRQILPAHAPEDADGAADGPAMISRRRLLTLAPTAAVGTMLAACAPSSAGLEALDAPGLPGLTAGGWPVKGVRYADLKGFVTLVHAFASWCPVCRDEYPYIKALSSDRRFRLVGLMVMDKQANATKFISTHGNPHAALGFDTNGAARRLLGVRGVPSTFVVDRQGRVVKQVPGALSHDYFKHAVLPSIEKALRA